MAPPGKSLLLSMFLCEWSHWEKLKGDPAAYMAEKERTAEARIGALETHYPGIRNRVEMVDVATPLTYERFTGNWKGTHMSWQYSGEFQRRHRFIPKTVPGLEGSISPACGRMLPADCPARPWRAEADRGGKTTTVEKACSHHRPHRCGGATADAAMQAAEESVVQEVALPGE